MIALMEAMFGRTNMWDHVVIEVTFWSYDQRSIDERERAGVNETTALKDINENLKTIAHFNKSLEGVFIDSHAYPIEQEQMYFTKYTSKLWTMASEMSTLKFMDVEDILEDPRVCQKETDCDCDVINGRLDEMEKNMTKISDDVVKVSEDVTQISDEVALVSDDVTANGLAILDNKDNIGLVSGRVTMANANINKVNLRVDEMDFYVDAHGEDIVRIDGAMSAVQNDVATNADAISTNQDDVATNADAISNNQHDVATNADAISTNQNDVATNADAISRIDSALAKATTTGSDCANQ